jgi:ubiquinone/menaquinone biosynthesis C-methylase UbiE
VKPSPWLLGKLRCPLGGGALRAADGALVAEATGRRWGFTPEGVPDLLVPSPDAESRRVEDANERFHDSHAEVYDRETVRPDDAYEGVSRTLARLVAEHGAAREFLDAGCGSGVVLRRVKPLVANVAGVDLSRGMLARCLPLHADLVRATATRLPFGDASFDGVSGYSLLHHLREPVEALREFHRVLRPGGFLWTDNDSNAAFHRRFGWWLEIRRAAKTKRARTAEDAELERLAEFHHGTGLDAESLRADLLAAGFSRAEVVHAHPPKPDEFTKLLIQLERHEPSPSLRYYFQLIAWK